MFPKGTEIQGFPILIKVLFVMFFLFINSKQTFSENLQLKDNESEEFIIESSKVSRSEVIEVSQQCLKRSKYKDEYFINKFDIHYDKRSRVWGVQFRKKNNQEDQCMYGVIVEKDTGAVMCQCLYGL